MRLSKLAILILSCLFLLFLPTRVFAQEEFLTDISVEYRIQENGTAIVTHQITLENVFSNLYATSYGLVLNNIKTQDLKAYKDGQSLRFEKKEEGEVTKITVFFAEPVVGKGKTQTFNVSFSNPNFATRTGEVWEISIPRLSNDNTFRSYTLTLAIPASFGNEAYISPKAIDSRKEGNWLYYIFNKESVEKTGITAGFGSFQVFSFTLKYHLENPLNKKSSTEIALPPDTALQKVYYQEISPQPANVYADEDGNWIASYLLEPRQRVDIEAKGAVQIFATVRPFAKPSPSTLEENLRESTYWQTSNTQIKEIARRLQTAREIYNFVYQNLKYDYERVAPNVDRMGAVEALNSPDKAICMEFTDLFIALARAAGIPAREINGYAYTENPKIQPLSLVADVLHSWPEYWNAEAKSWIPVDPTWASTTGGVDFFSKLDLRHFTFVIHGKDPVKPYAPGSYKLGANPQKDVFVSFGQLPEERNSQPEIKAEIVRSFPFSSSKLSIEIKNPGPVALYDLAPQVYFDNKVNSKESIDVLPPYSSINLTVLVPYSFLGRSTPNTITISALDKSLAIPTFKNQVIIYDLLAIFLILSIVIFSLLIRFKKLNFNIIDVYLNKLITKLKNVKKTSNSDPTPPNK